jgi:DNA-binding transcriptional LysR family regulator
MHDWGDVKFFLATAHSGSTMAAARELGVNQTTVARRIGALETALSVRLFNRNQDGYRVTEAGSAVLAHAQRMAIEAEALERLLVQHKRNLSGVVRVTTTENFARIFLGPLLSEFIELYPEIKIELIASDERLDLARGEADIAIRMSYMPSDSGVVARKFANDPWALFCSSGYAAKRGSPNSADELNNHFIVGAEGARHDPYTWLAATAPHAKVRSVCNTLTSTLAAIQGGHGVGALPRAISALDTDLVECFALPQFKYGYYLITRADMKDVPRVKAFNQFLIARAAKLKHVLEGRPPKQVSRASQSSR